ncbi:hypothetical protein CapIbe_022295 [Capra ibex]
MRSLKVLATAAYSPSSRPPLQPSTLWSQFGDLKPGPEESLLRPWRVPAPRRPQIRSCAPRADSCPQAPCRTSRRTGSVLFQLAQPYRTVRLSSSPEDPSCFSDPEVPSLRPLFSGPSEFCVDAHRLHRGPGGTPRADPRSSWAHCTCFSSLGDHSLALPHVFCVVLWLLITEGLIQFQLTVL